MSGLTLGQPVPVGLAVAAAWLLTAALSRSPGRALARSADRSLTRHPIGTRLRPYAGPTGLALLAILFGLAPEGPAHLGLLALGVVAGAALAWARADRDVTDDPETAPRLPPARGPRRAAQVTGITLHTLAWLIVLLLLGRPACDRTVIEWDRPLLVVLLDQSESMGLSDDPVPPASGRTRADRVNAALAAAAHLLNPLHELYDVRTLPVGDVPPTAAHAAEDWHIRPTAPFTPLADTLRAAATLRSGSGQPPATVLVVSDGAENVAEPGALPAAAEALAALGTPLHALGVGPEPGRGPRIEVAPLAVPARVGLRDTLRATVHADVLGYAGRTAHLDLIWNETITATHAVDLPRDLMRLATTLTATPPAPGVHRLSARVRVGDDAATVSTLVEVVVEQARVVFIERSPSPDFAFALRALPAETDFQAQRRLLGTPGTERLADACTSADVVVLGRLTADVTAADHATLLEAVVERGVGVFLAGGIDLLGDAGSRPSPLDIMLPAEPPRERSLSPTPVRVTLAPAGARHPIFARQTPTDAAEPWPALPPLSAAMLFGPPKPAAVVLAVDERNRPLLIAQDLGRGRVLAAAWEELWPWALASDAGHALHTRFWRQAITWLANRRPTACVVTDQPRYSSAALTGGRQRVRIRAGLSVPPETDRPDADRPPRLSLRSPGSESLTDVPLRADGPAWVAELPLRGEPLPAGTYELRFSAPLAGGGAATATELTAAARFEVDEVSVELQPPTADLAALAAAADRTRPLGGSYRPVEGLPELLSELTRVDRRRRLERTVRAEWLTSDPWGLFGWLTTLLSAEWILRRRCGWA